jgi:bacteriocin biosynthesis cyclodehydratase domain-containing protein
MARRPRLALPFTILTGPDTVRLVAGEDFRYSFTAPALETWLPDWLAGLDGSAKLDDAVGRLPDAHRAAARRLADRLYGERVLIDGTAADAHVAGECRLTFVGSARWIPAEAGSHASSPAIPPEHLTVFCQDRLDYREALQFNRERLASGERWFWATTGPMGRAYVSPLFLPDAGPCLACLLNHFRRLSPVADLYDDLTARAAAGGEIPAVPFPPPAVEIVRQMTVWKAGLVAETQAPAALYRLHVLEVGTLEVSSHRVIVDPECPACGRRT